MKNQKDLETFAGFLEKAGYEGAMFLIMTELVPLAIRKKITVYEAAQEYAKDYGEQDTSWYQLRMAFTEMCADDHAKIKELDLRMCP